MSWTLDMCSGGPYPYGAYDYAHCCLNEGEYDLSCYDSGGDGWHGGYLEIGGERFCEDFTSGEQQTQTINVNSQGIFTPPPRDCAVGSWGSWEDCTKTCRGGVQERSREVTTPAAYGGAACPDLEETRQCNQYTDCYKNCVKITTGSCYYCDGYITVNSYAPNKQLVLAGNVFYDINDVIHSKCYGDSFSHVTIQGEKANAWTGKIEFSRDGTNWAPMRCVGCQQGESTSSVYVDWDANGKDMATTHCYDSKVCKIYPPLETNCVKIVTGTHTDASGKIAVYTSGGSAVKDVTDGVYPGGSNVLDKCFGGSTNSFSIQVQGPGTNGWAGSIKYAEDRNSAYAPMECTYRCQQGTSTGAFAVDYNSDAADLAGSRCFDNKKCTLRTGPTTNCVRIVTATRTDAQGYIKVYLNNAQDNDVMIDYEYRQGAVVLEKCYGSGYSYTGIKGIHKNGWQGSIKFEKNAGDGYRNMKCTSGCESVGYGGDVGVDKNGDVSGSTKCINEKFCKFEPA